MGADNRALDSLPSLRQVIATHKLSARKSLGQNFLLDPNLSRRIARNAGPLEGVTVLEIGPGPGGLTRALLEQGALRVIAIERDERCLGALEDIGACADGRLRVIAGDALSFDILSVLPASGAVRVVANLPYNIATPLLLKLISGTCFYDRLVLMFQREVALRLGAAPGTGQYGRLSVAVQWQHDVRPLFGIPPTAFVPAPKVHSMLVAITPRDRPPEPAVPKFLETVTRAAFGQRRKMLRSALSGLFPDPETTLRTCGIDPTARAETLRVEDYCALARALEARSREDTPSSHP